ncbi:MAG: Rieske (2Fe-2S) protein [Aeromicrobium sp.]
MTIESTDRRTVLRGVAVIGAGAALTACGSKADNSNAGTGGSTTDAPTTGGTGGGTTVGKASDVPVGSGKIFADQKVVVTQLTKGDFKAYTAVCTHQGCIVSRIDAKEIHCPCHGSVYSTKDGSVINGPAPQPLKAETITDDAGTLKLG